MHPPSSALLRDTGLIHTCASLGRSHILLSAPPVCSRVGRREQMPPPARASGGGRKSSEMCGFPGRFSACSQRRARRRNCPHTHPNTSEQQGLAGSGSSCSPLAIKGQTPDLRLPADRIKQGTEEAPGMASRLAGGCRITEPELGGTHKAIWPSPLPGPGNLPQI